jgi:C-terminal processing protease CtpA/Prc
MVGRLDPADNILAINGTGTSSAWHVLPKIQIDSMKIKTSESGVGPSDHTSFYLKDIPVLHFFTGTHDDYHKPSDDEYKINYDGIADVNDYVFALIDSLDDYGKIDFQKTKEDTMTAPKFTVTLGVVPDYMYDGKGMRIDGVTEGKPASNAGLKTGDVVIRLGEIEIVDMMSYMKGLAQFKKGDKTTVKVLRDGSEVELEIQF